MVSLTAEEKALPYAKYFYRELARIPQEKLAVAEGPALKPEEILPIEARNLYLAGKDSGAQVGFGVAENGTGYVANRTFLAGITPEMMEWWFAWHPIESDLRYKLWDHDDHYYARADKPGYIKDPSVPMREKTWGVDHSVLEDIGTGPAELLLHFQRPAFYGYDETIIGSEYCTSLVCAAGEGSAPAFMTHKFYAAEGGTMLVSRFWMGYIFADGQFVKVIPDGVSMPVEAPRALFAHNIKEFTNLAAILGPLYEEEKGSLAGHEKSL